MPRRGPPFGQRHSPRWQRWQPAPGYIGAEANSAMNTDVGGRLRQIRETRGLTIRALAEQSGLAINTLSLIENGKSSPSVSTLQQLAVALNVPITAFFEIAAPPKKIAFSKTGQRPKAAFEHGRLEDLGAGSMIQAVEPFFVSLEPDAGSGPQEIVHTGYEFVYCLEGRILYTIEGSTYLLEPGDSLLFEAHLPHRWQNLSASESRSILVLVPTDEKDEPGGRHFMFEETLW